MEDSMGNVIVFYQVEHLRFIDVAGIGERVENSIRIERKVLPVTHQDSVFRSSS
jgi:hypothetical protein